MTSPSATWAQLSTLVEWRDLVAIGDYIVTGKPFENQLPLGSIAELAEAHEIAGASRGARSRARALQAIGVGPYSRPDSLSGILFSAGGLPPALINEAVLDARGSFLALPDRTWPEFRVAYEYEGDSHRSRGRYRSDVHRVERLVDHDWLVVKATADDLFDRPIELLNRVGSRLAGRGWSGRVRELRQFVPFKR